MSVPAPLRLQAGIQWAVDALERLHLLQGIECAAKSTPSLLHQSWLRMLWNTTYDAVIASIGALIDTRLDSHGTAGLAYSLKALPNAQQYLALICDLELVADRVQTPFLAIKTTRHLGIAHNGLSEQTLFGPNTAELQEALECVLELLSRTTAMLQLQPWSIDHENLKKYTERTCAILVAGMLGAPPPGIIIEHKQPAARGA